MPSTGNQYYMVNDYFQGLPVTDFAIVEVYGDGSRNVLLVAGISGYATYYASQWLYQKTVDGTIRDYDVRVFVLRLDDADGNPESTPPTIIIQELVPA